MGNIDCAKQALVRLRVGAARHGHILKERERQYREAQRRNGAYWAAHPVTHADFEEVTQALGELDLRRDFPQVAWEQLIAFNRETQFVMTLVASWLEELIGTNMVALLKSKKLEESYIHDERQVAIGEGLAAVESFLVNMPMKQLACTVHLLESLRYDGTSVLFENRDGKYRVQYVQGVAIP